MVKWVQPNKHLVRLYLQCIIAPITVHSFLYDVSTLILSAVFMAYIIFLNIFCFAIRERMSLIVVAIIGIIFFITVVLNVLFVIGCSYYTTSSKVLLQWRNVTGRKDAYMHRIVKSLPILALPAGEAGIIDTEIKVNYLYSLLLNTTNSILTVQSLM